jgi:hypothetical protein
VDSRRDRIRLGPVPRRALLSELLRTGFYLMMTERKRMTPKLNFGLAQVHMVANYSVLGDG